jgi:hypothetical protein
MAFGSEVDRLRVGEISAKRRFPAKARVVDQLIGTSQDFRDMLEELAEVERALADMARGDCVSDRKRRDQWLQCLEHLTAEIEDMLQYTGVIWIDIGRLFRRR